MNNTTNNSNAPEKPWPLYIIVGMVAFVLILGYVLSPKTEEEKLAWIELLGTTNRGVLLNPPTEVNANNVLDETGSPWTALDDNTWKLLLLNTGLCDQSCTDRLVEMHAMRIRLNRDSDRLTIGLLTNVEQSLPDEIAAYEDINLLYLGGDELLSALQQTNIPTLDGSPIVLLMNPIDTFMMFYEETHSSVEILEDFEYLLDLAH